MADRKFFSNFFARLLKRTGGVYLLLSTLLVQLTTNLLLVPAVILVQSNASLETGALWASVRAALVLTIISNALMLFVTYLVNRDAFRRLDAWKRSDTLPAIASQERKAWREITHFPWRYGLFSLLSALFVVVLPLMAYQGFVLHLTSDQIIYTLLGGIVAVLMIISAGAIGVEWISQPAREVLLPADFEAQAQDVLAINIYWKLQIFIVAMVTTGIVTIAPLGYRKIVQVVEGLLKPEEALREYQVYSIVVALVILVIASGLTALISNLFSTPFSQLVETFKQVEEGRLDQRARVIATDEAGQLEIHFNRMLSQLESLQTSLENLVADRTAQLEAVIEVGRAASAILDPDELIENVVNLITNRFGHYYAAIFLLDVSGQWAELKNATGEAGRVLRESRHRLAVDSKSMVGTAIAQKTARIALDVGLEPVRFNNPLLPYTRSEIALPLMVGDRVLGALDVQSTRESAFKPEDIETLQSMANQVSIALENARLFQETNQRLLELQNSQRQYLHRAWSAAVEEADLEYRVGDSNTPDEKAAIQVPLSLRDETIGLIRLIGDEDWSPEERAWIESVATQASIALENARLMEESRKLAAMERTVAEITTRIWSADTVDGILQTATKEIGRALNLSEATIELTSDTQGGTSRE